MLRLDRLMGDRTATYSGDVSVEHVMPQQPAPNSQWLKSIPENDKYQDWVHRLGNLVLLSRKKNSAASNYEFERKKEAYFYNGGACSFAITLGLQGWTEWTMEVMEQRQEKAMKRLEEHWRLEGRKTSADIAATLIQEFNNQESEAEFQIISKRHGIKAIGKPDQDEHFVVQAGSHAKLDWNHQASHAYKLLRNKLIEDEVLMLSNDNNRFIFMNDYRFDSPSAASSVILGRSDNGRTSWKYLGTDISYYDWHRTRQNQ
jgi:hypothetical protein